MVFDTETTGISDDRAACELAIIEIDWDLRILGDCETKLNPQKPISPEATAVHGMTLEELANEPTIGQWVEEVLGGRLDEPIVLIGHKVSFDAPMFRSIGSAIKLLDTLTLSWVYYPDCPNKKLDTLKEYLGLPGGGVSHRAGADALTCFQLLEHIVKTTGRSLRSLVETPYYILHRMPWGKHEGKLLTELPSGYRRWLLDLDPNSLDASLRRSVELVAQADVPLTAFGRRKITIPRKYV